jgi:L-amino acid N-acyltransferase YncA
MIVRAPETGDRDALHAFLAAVPESERNFFREDVADPEIVDKWIRGSGERRLVMVEDDGAIAGQVVVRPGFGWSSHVGEVSLIVSPAHRGRGVGRELARRIVLESVELGLTHIYVQVVAAQEALIGMFGGLRFEPEALLRDFVRDRSGSCHDLIVLTHRVEENWSEMLTLGLPGSIDLES